MSSHNKPIHSVSPKPQHDLWTILSWHFPASIVKTLRSTPDIHSNELHLLYTILISCQFRTPDHLYTKIHTLPDPIAAQIVSNLEELDIGYPKSTGREEIVSRSHCVPNGSMYPICKPLFYTAEREEFYSLVQRLFAAGFLGDKADGSKRAQVHNFETLHVLYRLGAEHIRSKRHGETELTEPNHEWYHETSDALVAQWTRYLWALAPQEGEDDEGDGRVSQIEHCE